MGLFDNIFLDQNTPTAMLDPLVDNKTNTTSTEEIKPQTASVDTNESSSPMSVPTFDAVSFDDIQSKKNSVTEETKGFLSGSDPTLESSDDISFDIGGLDMSSFSEDQTSVSLSSDIPVVTLESDVSIPDTIIMDTPNMNQEVTDSSIALVQGATAASSDTIIDNISSISIDEADSGNKIDTLVVDDTSVSNDMVDSMITIPSSEGEETSGIMGLFSTNEVSSSVGTPLVSSIEVSPASVEDPILPILTHNITDAHNPSDMSVSSMSSTDIDNSVVVSEVTSNDTLNVSSDSSVVISNFSAVARGDVDSPLQEMLREFVVKLEKFNTESETLDTEMLSMGTALIQEEQDLKREYDIRMNAIQYKRKHMEDTRVARQAEKTRLERIIANLRQEIK